MTENRDRNASLTLSDADTTWIRETTNAMTAKVVLLQVDVVEWDFILHHNAAPQTWVGSQKSEMAVLSTEDCGDRCGKKN